MALAVLLRPAGVRLRRGTSTGCGLRGECACAGWGGYVRDLSLTPSPVWTDFPLLRRDHQYYVLPNKGVLPCRRGQGIGPSLDTRPADRRPEHGPVPPTLPEQEDTPSMDSSTVCSPIRDTGHGVGPDHTTIPAWEDTSRDTRERPLQEGEQDVIRDTDTPPTSPIPEKDTLLYIGTSLRSQRMRPARRNTDPATIPAWGDTTINIRKIPLQERGCGTVSQNTDPSTPSE